MLNAILRAPIRFLTWLQPGPRHSLGDALTRSRSSALDSRAQLQAQRRADDDRRHLDAVLGGDTVDDGA